MASVTLYDGETGDPIVGEATDHPDPIVTADDHAGVTFALDPASGAALVQFVTDPGTRRLVASLELDDGDDLPDLYRTIQERIVDSDHSMAPPGTVPPHLNVFHYLAAPDPVSPDTGIRGYVVATDDPIEVAAPTAAEAAGVAAFFRERAPWKTVAVHSAGTTVATGDAAVSVVVDGRYDEVTYLGRDECWVDEDAVPTERPDRVGGAATTSGEATAVTTDAAAARAGEAGATATADPDGRETTGDASPVLRIYDGATGELEYDSRRTGDAPATVSEDAKRAHRDGLALLVDPAAGVLRAIIQARGTGVETQFVVEYDRCGSDEDLLESFAGELADRVDDLGVTFFVDVEGDEIDYDQLRDAAGRRPEALSGADLEWLRRTDEPLEFAAPGGAAAFELAAFLQENLGGDRSIAICAAGRTEALSTTDVVVIPESDGDGIEPRGATATGLADRRLNERMTDVGATIRAMVGRVDEVTGTMAARQRVFAAALSGTALAGRGLTAAPVDDRPIGRRRRQARYLTLYGLLLAGLAGGVHLGQFDSLAALVTETYRIEIGPLAGTPAERFQGPHSVEGRAVVGGSLAAVVLGAYWLLGHPLGPLAAGRSLVGTVWRQITGGVGSGTVPSTVRELADPLQSSIDDLGTAYDHLADSEGTTASRADDFGAFLEQELLAGPLVPKVALVSRRARWRQLLVGIATGVLVGAVSGIALLGALWFAVHSVRADPTLGLNVLLGVAAVVLLASAVKAIAVRYGRGRPPRWSTTR